MKKILTIAIAVMMIAVMSVSVFAADSGTIYVKDLVSGTDYEGLSNMNLQTGKGEEADAKGGVLGLSPAAEATAHVTFTVNAEKAGTYTLVVRYAAKKADNQNRCFDVSVNGGEKKTFENLGGSDWNTYFDATIENVHLNAGANTVKLTNVDGFDNNTYKAVNVLSLTYTLVEADPTPDTGDNTPDTGDTTPDTGDTTPDTGDNTPDTGDTTPDTNPTPDTPSTDDKAPQTGVAVAILSAVAALSGAYIVSKKH